MGAKLAATEQELQSLRRQLDDVGAGRAEATRDAEEHRSGAERVAKLLGDAEDMAARSSKVLDELRMGLAQEAGGLRLVMAALEADLEAVEGGLASTSTQIDSVTALVSSTSKTRCRGPLADLIREQAASMLRTLDDAELARTDLTRQVHALRSAVGEAEQARALSELGRSELAKQLATAERELKREGEDRKALGEALVRAKHEAAAAKAGLDELRAELVCARQALGRMEEEYASTARGALAEQERRWGPSWRPQSRSCSR